jgi:hypothetical protein
LIGVLALSLLAACSGGDDNATPTTTSAAPSSSAAPPSSTSTTSAEDAARRQAFVDGEQRFLTPPEQPSTRAGDAADCALLGDSGWEVVGCGRVTGQAGDAVWLHERRQAAERALLYVRDPSGWRLAQRASDETGTEFDASVQAVDLMGDGAQKVVFTFRILDKDDSDGVTPSVVADVVEPTGVVVVHVVATYSRGRPTVRPTPGRGLEVWDCEVDCVSTAPYRYRRIAFAEGRWSVVEQRTDQKPPA